MKPRGVWFSAERIRGSLSAGAGLLILFLLYFGTGRLGLSLGAVSGFATLVRFPSGLAITALLLFGFRLWPAIFLGALLLNRLNGAPLPVAVGIGNTLEALVCATLLKRWQIRFALDSLHDVLLLVLLAAPVGSFISATLGVASLLLGGVIVWSAAFATWGAWWMGDLISILILTPLLLTWRTWPQVPRSFKRLAELGLLSVRVVAIGLFVFLGLLHPDHQGYPITYLVSPPFSGQPCALALVERALPVQFSPVLPWSEPSKASPHLPLAHSVSGCSSYRDIWRSQRSPRSFWRR